MAETNSDTPDDKSTPVVDDDKPVTEEDLRDLKYPKDDVETSKEEDEPSGGEEPEDEPEKPADEPDDQIDEPPATDEEEEPAPDTPPAFVKEFDYIKGDTPEEYARNLEKAYTNSTAEALRLKQELEAPPTTPETKPAEPTGDDKPEDNGQQPVSPLELYAKQMLDKDITKAFAQFQTDYPQVSEKPKYDTFTRRVALLSETILQDEGRLADPAELYGLAALSLGWDKADPNPDSKEKLGAALKDKAATGRPSSSAGTKPKSPSKVSEEMIKVNQRMYPGKSREDIIKELEPHIT